MISHTKQEWFDLAVNGLKKQNWQRSMTGGSCRYRGNLGFKCAIGHGISDEQYNYDWDRNVFGATALLSRKKISVSDLGYNESAAFLTNLQISHDCSISKEDMIDRFLNFAIKYNLTYPEDLKENNSSDVPHV